MERNKAGERRSITGMGGVRLKPAEEKTSAKDERLDRIEAKLDAILETLRRND